MSVSNAPMLSVVFNPDVEMMMAPEFRAVFLQGGRQARVLEDTRVQFMREMSDVVRKTGSGLLNHGERFVNVALRSRLADATSETAEHHRETRKPLADVVVELARDASPFHFLRGNQSPGKILILLVALSKRPLTLA